MLAAQLKHVILPLSVVHSVPQQACFLSLLGIEIQKIGSDYGKA